MQSNQRAQSAILPSFRSMGQKDAKCRVIHVFEQSENRERPGLIKVSYFEVFQTPGIPDPSDL